MCGFLVFLLRQGLSLNYFIGLFVLISPMISTEILMLSDLRLFYGIVYVVMHVFFSSEKASRDCAAKRPNTQKHMFLPLNSNRAWVFLVVNNTLYLNVV